MKRLDEPELLDEHDAPREDMERSLRDLRRINRWLGGVTTYRRLLRRFPGVRSVLDLGAGTADLLDSIDGDVLRIALDFKIDHLLYRREQSRARRVVGDATKLPFRNGSIDLVTSSHFFHHFTPQENTAILADAVRVARRGVAITDTRRHFAPWLFIRTVAALHLVGRITRLDGPASVRRGYTIDEVRRIAGEKAEVRRFFPFRFGLMLRK